MHHLKLNNKYPRSNRFCNNSDMYCIETSLNLYKGIFLFSPGNKNIIRFRLEAGLLNAQFKFVLKSPNTNKRFLSCTRVMHLRDKGEWCRPSYSLERQVIHNRA